ncbi:hypothetical protein [uncultured Methanobrevibacter sp.]|uniref:hypothetical protein n=1 Tax=uncultured Methanobrevibacter sp. TaxID=253161 RepID=UPI0025E945B3|nr:hypothetical protein [uncultured Methanobrevibacter sp.]
MTTLDALFCIINAHGVIGLCYWISKYLPDAIIKAVTILSRNINTIYIAQWFFVPLTIIFLSYFFRDLIINDLLNSIIAICMILLATLVSIGYNKLKNS